MHIKDYKRIVIVGNNGSGKSYLARELATITHLPLVHLDCKYWKPDWTHPNKSEWEKIQHELVSKQEWIMDGNHTNTLNIRLEKADLVIFVNVNRLTCFLSVIMRNRRKRSDIPRYLKVIYNRAFLKFLWGLMKFNSERKPLILNQIQNTPSIRVLHIRGRKDMRRLLREWSTT